MTKFYKTTAWIKLSQEVMREQHFECQLCKQRGRYEKGKIVHHVNYVKHKPELALSKYYIDKNGNQARNLIVVCDYCHNQIHKTKHNKKFVNQERW